MLSIQRDWLLELENMAELFNILDQIYMFSNLILQSSSGSESISL